MYYTRAGDDGTSGLFGTKARHAKDSPIFEALGTVDELISLLGVCRASLIDECSMPLRQVVRTAQERLFIIQAGLAGADYLITSEHLAALERDIDTISADIINPNSFIIPGANVSSANFDLARAVARRAERRVIAVAHKSDVTPETIAYLNRLSSLLYVIARCLARNTSCEEARPQYS
jgi:cob(I)alamin adenosyltransferase